MQQEKKNIQIPNIEPVKFVQRSNGSIKGYAANTFHGLVKDFNEDRVSIIMNITKPNHKGKWPKCSYFAVFDGHGGHMCSDFLKDNMHKYITESQYFPHEPIEALKAGFRKAEIQFVKLAESKNPPERSGSCALVILVIDQMCYIANVGDSRAILSYQSGSKVFPLSHDHKPDTVSEKQRIINGGGKVYQSMLKTKVGVNIPGPFRLLPGKLSVSRSFGDIEAKIQKYGGNPKVLIAKPEITYFEIDPNNHDFIMMGSDGIFDKLTNEQIVDCFWFTHDKNKNKSNEYIGEAASRIITSSMKNLSMDNLTSVLIMFDDEGRLDVPRKKTKHTEKLLQNSSSLKKHENYNNLNIDENKKERGLSSKMVEKMTLKRKSVISSANTSHKIDASKKSMKNLRKEATWKVLPGHKSENKENDLVKLIKSKQVDKIR